ncbi:MAG: hypothetical protein M3Q64_03375 [bacterium]|nr:hypothetical protein [bacterium]
MENEQTKIPLNQEQMLREMHADMRKAKNYMKWQLIITVSLVVIPLLASLFIIPFTIKSLTSTFINAGIDSSGGPQAEALKQFLQ